MSGVHQKKHSQQVKGRDSATLLCSGETPPGLLHLSLGPPAQERHGLIGMGPEENSKNDQGMEHLS